MDWSSVFNLDAVTTDVGPFNSENSSISTIVTTETEPTLSTYTMTGSALALVSSVHAMGSVVCARSDTQDHGQQFQSTYPPSNDHSVMSLIDTADVNNVPNTSQCSSGNVQSSSASVQFSPENLQDNRVVEIGNSTNSSVYMDPASDNFEAYFTYFLTTGDYSYNVLLDYVRQRLAYINSHYDNILGFELIDELSRIILDQCLRGDFNDMYAMLRNR